jgi:malonyl-CoA decarboxylase
MSDIAVPGLLDRAIRRITTAWRDMATSVPDESIATQMRACLEGRGGEVSARNRAAKLAETYQGQDEAGRKEFLRTLASFDSDPDAVATVYTAVQAAADPAERATAKAALRRALSRRDCGC